MSPRACHTHHEVLQVLRCHIWRGYITGQGVPLSDNFIPMWALTQPGQHIYISVLECTQVSIPPLPAVLAAASLASWLTPHCSQLVTARLHTNTTHH